MFINVIDWKECGEYITIKVKKSNDLTKNYKKNGGNMKRKKILTGLLCAAVVGNLVAGVAPGMMCDVSAASAQTSTGYQYKDIYATERVTIKGINVNEVVIASANPIVTRPMTKPVKFVIYK